MDKLTHEIISFGSMHEALTRKWITPSDALQGLHQYTWNNNTEFMRAQVAYSALCDFIPVSQQFINDIHIICGRREYIGIALRKISFTNALVRRDSDNFLVDEYTADILTILQNKRKSHEYRTYAGSPTWSTINGPILFDYLFARFFPNTHDTVQEINADLVDADWFDKFRYRTELAVVITDRCNFLKENAPLYYEKAKLEYDKVSEKLYHEGLLYELDFSNLENFALMFPNVFSFDIFKYSNCSKKLLTMPPFKAGYFLGFPIYNMIPSQKQIHQRITILEKMGIDKYCQMMQEQTRKITKPVTFNKCRYSNNEDVLGDKIETYSSYDIIPYQTGEYIYRFTRPEFQQLISSGRNHWTNLTLEDTILEVMKSRSALKIKPLPLVELLKNLERGEIELIQDDPSLTLNYLVEISDYNM